MILSMTALRFFVEEPMPDIGRKRPLANILTWRLMRRLANQKGPTGVAGEPLVLGMCGPVSAFFRARPGAG